MARIAVFVRRPTLNWFRSNLGRSEPGGENSTRFPMSVFPDADVRKDPGYTDAKWRASF